MAGLIKKNFTISQGAKFDVEFRRVDTRFQPVDLTYWTPRLTARASPTSVELIERVESYQCLRNGLTAGTIRFKMDAEDTAARDFTVAGYDLELVKCTLEQIPYGGGFTSAALDVNNGSDLSTLTANGGTPFAGSVVAVGDVIRISNSRGHNNGSFVVSAKTNTVITFTYPMPGSDQSAETGLILYRLVLDETNVIRFAAGKLTLSKENTY